MFQQTSSRGQLWVGYELVADWSPLSGCRQHHSRSAFLCSGGETTRPHKWRREEIPSRSKTEIWRQVFGWAACFWFDDAHLPAKSVQWKKRIWIAADGVWITAKTLPNIFLALFCPKLLIPPATTFDEDENWTGDPLGNTPSGWEHLGPDPQLSKKNKSLFKQNYMLYAVKKARCQGHSC